MQVFKEFVETFQEAPSSTSKVWVKAGTYDAGARSKYAATTVFLLTKAYILHSILEIAKAISIIVNISLILYLKLCVCI